MMTRSGTSERSDFDARRSALMFERHLNRFGRRSKDWAGNIHHGGTFDLEHRFGILGPSDAAVVGTRST